MGDIRTYPQLQSLQAETVVLAIVVVLLSLALSILVSHLIAFEGGKHSRDSNRRRVAFFAIGFAAFGGFFLFNMFSRYPRISTALISSFETTNVITSIGVLVLYIAAGFGLSKLWATGPYGTIFPRKSR